MVTRLSGATCDVYALRIKGSVPRDKSLPDPIFHGLRLAFRRDYPRDTRFNPCELVLRSDQSPAVDRPPQRHKFELALLDIRRCLVDPPMEDRADALPRAAMQVDRFVESIACDPDKTKALIDTVRAVLESTGPGSTTAEAKLMRSLASTAYWCVDGLAAVPPSDAKQRLEVLRQLAGYAVESLAFRRPRDSFGSRRRSIAFEVLTDAHPYLDLPEAVRVARSIVLSAAGNDFRGAIDFLKARFEQRREEPDQELVDALLGVAERTRSRSIAFGALDFLVETGVIGEFQALDRLDAWKERNERRG